MGCMLSPMGERVDPLAGPAAQDRGGRVDSRPPEAPGAQRPLAAGFPGGHRRWPSPSLRGRRRWAQRSGGGDPPIHSAPFAWAGWPLAAGVGTRPRGTRPRLGSAGVGLRGVAQKIGCPLLVSSVVSVWWARVTALAGRGEYPNEPAGLWPEVVTQSNSLPRTMPWFVEACFWYSSVQLKLASG